ncbi:YceH family protein [Comamonas sp. 17RB]|uniref:YceH family protein n=1 Tax=Comamonas sp. 17RB TaxID=3047025 RepID=UPI0024B65FDF|nr:YceH family protein [Comamonas sp. 17RB]MDI9857056.1 YceH family protein [Comamonas sp. 17RB]
MPFDHRAQPLSPHAARVLATLMEKARTVPDSYPLTVNSLQSGCNQKTSRAPVMQLSEGDIQAALDELRQRHLVMEASGQRATRWEHNFERVVGVPSQASAILGLLMLRGPQTAGELRINTERWHRFADIGSVEAFLEELRDRSDEKGGPLVVLLPRAPGAREARWAHLLCGEVDVSALAAANEAGSAAPSDSATAQRLAALEAEVALLRATVQQLCSALGVEAPVPHSSTDSAEQNPPAEI